MTEQPGAQPGLDAALLKLADQGEKLASQGEKLAQFGTTLAELSTLVQGLRGTQHDQGEILRGLEGIREKVSTLTKRFDALFPPEKEDGSEFYNPEPTARFWKLEGQEREAVMTRLRQWVDDVYRPQFGHIAKTLPGCWEQHMLCLTILDVLRELQFVLYMQPIRTQGMLSGQAELLARVMPGLADLMTKESANCEHSPGKWLAGADRRRTA